MGRIFGNGREVHWHIKCVFHVKNIECVIKVSDLYRII